jgi:DNA polymerase IV
MTSTPEEQRLEQKVKFYQELAALEDSDGSQDEGLRESIEALHHRRTRPVASSKAEIVKDTQITKPTRKTDAGKPGPRSPKSLPRSVSDVGPVTSRKSLAQGQAGMAQRATFDSPNMPSARNEVSAAPAPVSSMPQATGKRKRESVVTLVPPGQRIFDGLHFYFFPNNEKHPARLMRITKAITFGATWQRDWNDCVTHVILDKAMDYAMLLKFLKKDRLPDAVIVVNESWPSECIAYRALLDFSRPQFKVSGAVLAVPKLPLTEQVPVSSAGSETSLKLKPPSKEIKPRQRETQSPDKGEAVLEHTTLDTAATNAGVPGVETPKPAEMDELDAAISQARDLQHVPLDDEDGESRPSSSDGMTAQPPPHERPRGSKLSFQEKFQCMQKHTGEASGSANAATIIILQQMANYYGQLGDEWRTRAYRKAIATLRNHPTKVCTKEEALALPNVGERLATKIEEIAFTNRLRRLDNALAEPRDQILQTFMNVYGAGFVQASNWVRQGYTTLDELLRSASLTENQKIGIEHFEDFQLRVPRAEVAKHGEIVQRALHDLEPSFEITIGGSYRRGAKDSSDIDLIITCPDAGIDRVRTVVVNKLVPKLFSQGFLKAALAATSGDGSKWHGASCLPGETIWRRIDFLLVPWSEMGAALIYFTGNDIFNRSLRLLASPKGFRLDQRGLYKDVMRGKGREKITEGTLVESKDERKIFAALGVPWRPPEHRIP